MLTNPKRKTTYSTDHYGEWNCDQSGRSNTSPDWDGPGWYRISPSIGTKIPISPTKERYCGTWASGWISGGGSRPGLGQTVNAKVCFVAYGDNCYYNVNVQIKRCKDYTLYYLPNTPRCYRGYCVE